MEESTDLKKILNLELNLLWHKYPILGLQNEINLFENISPVVDETFNSF